jgi:hypothetical protein
VTDSIRRSFTRNMTNILPPHRLLRLSNTSRNRNPNKRQTSLRAMRGYFLVFVLSYNFLCSLYNSGYGHVTNFMTTFASRICSPTCPILDLSFMTTYDSFTPHKHIQVLLASFALCASHGLVLCTTIRSSYDSLSEYGARGPPPSMVMG